MDSPPWAAYRSLQTGRLIALDKSPGIRPIAIADVFYRLIAKVILHICGDEAKEACGTDQLCGGLEAGIEGCIHAMRTIWDLNNHNDDWGFFLLDAKNAFNNGNRYIMCWNVRHEWPSGSRFVFNMYRHWTTLIIRNNDMILLVFFPKKESDKATPSS